MNALSPWSGAFGAQLTDGSFTAGPMIWASAHTTQFTRAGWTYMLTAPAAGSGSGSLANGGTYVTLVDYTPGNAGDFTIVIEKMSRNHSSCVRPGLPDYPTSDETATFTLTGALARVSSLHLWSTHWAQYNGDVTHEFEKQADVPVVGGVFTLPITVDSIYTLTTMSGGGKGVPSAPPPTPFVFPTAHVDNFDACRVSSEANYFADQNGIFECFPAADPTHGIVMRQMIPLKPVTWGGDIRPHSLIGHRDGVNYSMVVDAYIEEPGASVLLGVRMQGTDNSGGIIWSIDTSGAWRVHRAIADVDDDGKAVITGTTTVNAGEWHTYRFDVNGSLANLWMDSVPVFSAFNVTAAGLTTTGHALIGTREYNHFTQYDNFQLYTSFVPPGGASLIVAGAPVGNVNCAADVGPQPGSTWSWSAAPGTMSGAFSLVANASLCLAAAAAPPNLLTLQPCDASSPYQTWAWTLDGIAPDGERKSQFKNAGLGACLDILGQVTDIGLQMDAWACNNGENQAFYWDFDQREIGNEATGTCVGVV